MDQMKTKREKVASIVEALLAKTTENSATEAEAMAAAAKARELWTGIRSISARPLTLVRRRTRLSPLKTNCAILGLDPNEPVPCH